MLDQASVSSWEAITALDEKNLPVDEDVPEKQQICKLNENCNECDILYDTAAHYA